MKKGDRKARIEATIKRAQKLSGLDAAVAWRKLWINLEWMADPEAAPPRFNALLRAIWTAASDR